MNGNLTPHNISMIGFPRMYKHMIAQRKHQFSDRATKLAIKLTEQGKYTIDKNK
jgi:hypothetical protein